MIDQNTMVEMYDYHEELKKVRLITLTTWAVALRAEVKGVQVSPSLVEPIVREFLGTPSDVGIEEISSYITEVHEEVKERIGL